MDFEYLKNKRLLLVDDEQDLLDMVVSILKTEGFHHIATAKTVKEALTLADSFQPELAILDVMLSDGNGFSLIEQLKKKGEYPILFLSWSRRLYHQAIFTKRADIPHYGNSTQKL